MATSPTPLEELPQEWQDQAQERFERMTRNSGVSLEYEDGFQAGWEHAADLLREALGD